MKLHLFDNPEAVEQNLLQRIVDQISERTKLSRCTLALSGGSTPRGLYSNLGKVLQRNPNLARSLTVMQVDERYVPMISDRSNQKMIKDALQNTDVMFTMMPTTDNSQDLYSAVSAYSAAIRELPQLDIVILGMGLDGHTASLFPNNEVYLQSMEKSNEVIGMYVESMNEVRVSLTPKIINTFNNKILYYTGADKAQTLVHAVESGDPTIFPILSVIEDTEIYTTYDPVYSNL